MLIESVDGRVHLEEARQVMELYIAADLSAETNEPVSLPLANKRPTRLAAGA